MAGDDRGLALGAAQVARLAEAVPGFEPADHHAFALYIAVARNDHIKTVVDAAGSHDLFALGVRLPGSGAQDLPSRPTESWRNSGAAAVEMFMSPCSCPLLAMRRAREQ